jgi:broad specificity phosphatase PhoE
MRKQLLFEIVVFLFLLFVGSLPSFGQRTVVVVRHADKIDDTDDAVLSPTGEDQAKRLAHVLKDVGINAIYTTQFKRTIQTAAPLADLLKLKLLAYEQRDVDGVVKDIQQKHPKDVVMVVGHRSTVPKILTQFGASEPVALESSEYDSLFILTLPPGQSPTLLHLRY